MWRDNRDIDPEFPADEDLYFRFGPAHVSGEIPFPPLIALHFPKASVNRSRYSNPIDVLIPDPDVPRDFYIDYRVAAIAVSAVPHVIAGTTGEFVTRVVHDPREWNYSHSEVQTYRTGNYQQPIEPDRPARLLLRESIFRAGVRLIPDEEIASARNEDTDA